MFAIGFVPGEMAMSLTELPMTRRGFLYPICEPVEFLILLCIDSQMVNFRKHDLLQAASYTPSFSARKTPYLSALHWLYDMTTWTDCVHGRQTACLRMTPRWVISPWTCCESRVWGMVGV